jgi:alcohol dehydrogenase
MLAMTYRGPYKIRVEEKDRPRIEHPGDAIVRVTLAAICGSDLHLYHGMMPDTRIGHTFGHEFIGVVDEVGADVRNLEVGDRVMVPFNIYCGSCYFCVRGLYSNCHNVNPNATAVGGIYGYSHTTGGYDGGQAEYVRVPFADVGPAIIPDWMSDEDAVMLTDALPTGYFGAQLGDIAEGDTVVVFGAGPVGLYGWSWSTTWTTASTRLGTSRTPRRTTSPTSPTSCTRSSTRRTASVPMS